MKRKYIFRTFFCSFLCLCFIFAESLEEYDKKIEQNTRQIQELNKQISRLHAEMKKYQEQEKSILSELDNTRRRISLSKEKIRLQNRELELRRAKQAELQRDYKAAQDRGGALIKRYEKRVQYAYKLRPARQMDLYVDATSPREFYYRVKYLSAVNRADRQLHQNIKSNLLQINRRRNQIREEEAAIRKNLAALQEEQKHLDKLQADQQKKYSKLSSDKAFLAEQLKEKEKSRKAIEKIIEKTQKDKKAYLARLEEERKKREVIEAPFSSKKGKLPWPVYGNVVTEFGRQVHPVLKTVTENSGIDIRSAAGNAVRAVSDGMVVTITWLRGYGNTIIVMHDNSYYSVYSHIENIKVVQGEYVDSGQQIAGVSSDASMDGAVLHFELWKDQEKLNPRSWLR